MKSGNRFLLLKNSTKFIIVMAVLLIGFVLYSVLREQTAPTSPSYLHAFGITSSSINLAWNKSTGVKDYQVYQNNKLIGSTETNHLTVKHLYPDTSYRFYIKVRDARGNISAPSKTIKARTLVAKQPIVGQIQVSPIGSDGKTISGTVTLSVKIKDDKRINRVEFYSNDGKYLIKTVNKAPYRVSWATNPWVPNGEQILKVVVYDSTNRVSEVKRIVTVKNSTASGQYKRIGYYTGWSDYSNFQVSNIDASMFTQLNYAFASISSDGKMILEDPAVDEKNYDQLTKLKQKNPNLKTVISVGGWDGSAKFSDIALTDQSRTVFANSCLQFILKYGFDGVDLDWEYPVAGGKPGNSKRPEDKQNYTLLIQKIRETFNTQSAKDGKTYLLTITGGVGGGFAADTELNLIQQYVDCIGLMAYDIHGSWDTMTGMDAPLYKDPHSGNGSDDSVQNAVQTYLDNGVPANKLVLGMPLYGRVYKQVNNQNNGNGLYQPFTGGGTAISYGNITANDLNQKGFNRYWDTNSKVPWLFNGTEFISYDDPESIGYKTAFVKSMGLGGAMMWELSQDPNKELIAKIYHDLE